MNNKTIKIIIFLILVVYTFLLFLFTQKSEINFPVIDSVNNKNEIENKLIIEKVSDINKKVPTINDDFIYLKVLDNSYEISLKDGDTVFDVMRRIEENKKNNFYFLYKEYSSLGIFITEINGIKGGNGKYWIYYVNDKEAEVGVSKYKLEKGDIISWKLK